jgi:hypothetical protein
MVVWLSLPLILARRLVKDVLLIVDSQNTVFHDTLPGKVLAASKL